MTPVIGFDVTGKRLRLGDYVEYTYYKGTKYAGYKGVIVDHKKGRTGKLVTIQTASGDLLRNDKTADNEWWGLGVWRKIKNCYPEEEWI